MGRRISAQFVLTGVSLPLNRGVVETNDKGLITAVIDTGGKLEESRNLEFYNGIILPGLLCPCRRLPEPSPENPQEKILQELDEWFFRNGFVAARLILPSPEMPLPTSHYGIKYLAEKISVPLHSSMVHSGDPFLKQKEEKEMKLFKPGIPGAECGPPKTITEIFFRLQCGQPGRNLPELLPFFGIHPAKSMGYDKILGSIEKGKTPGLNLIEPVNLAELRLLKESRIRRLV